MKADGIKATSQSDGTYVLDWSTEETNIDYSNVPHHTSRAAPAPYVPPLKGTDSDEDIDDKKQQ